MHRRGNSRGNGASCPILFPDSPLNVQTPSTQFLNSSAVMSLVRCRSRFHDPLYSTMTTSTGVMMWGALADFQLPHAVRLLMFPSFQTIVVWYFQPTSIANRVTSEDKGCLPFLFLSIDTLTHSLPVGAVHRKQVLSHCFVNFWYSAYSSESLSVVPSYSFPTL